MSRPRSHTGVGAASILLIIVVLALTTFGVLTLVSARNDRALTARATETAAAYYVADAAAQMRLMELDDALAGGAKPADLAWLAADGDAPDTYAFESETGDGRAIRTTVRMQPGEARYTVVSYTLIQLTDWSMTEDFTLAFPAQ